MSRTALLAGVIVALLVEAAAVSWAVADPTASWAVWRVALAAWPLAAFIGFFAAAITEAGRH